MDPKEQTTGKTNENQRLAEFVKKLYACPGLKNEKYRASITSGKPKHGKGMGPNSSKQSSLAIELDALRAMKINEWIFPMPGHESLEFILKKALTYRFTEHKKIKHSNFDELRNNSEILKSQIRSLEKKNEKGEYTSQIEDFKQALVVVETQMSAFASEKAKDNTPIVDNQSNLTAGKILRIFDAARREENESKNADDAQHNKVSNSARNKAFALYKCICQKMFHSSEEVTERDGHKEQHKYERPLDSDWRTVKHKTNSFSANVYVPPHVKSSSENERRYKGFRSEHEMKEHRESRDDKDNKDYYRKDRYSEGNKSREFYQKRDSYQKSSHKSVENSSGNNTYVPPHLREQKQSQGNTNKFDKSNDLDMSQEKFPSLVHTDVKVLTGAWAVSLSQEVLTRVPIKEEITKEEIEEDDDISLVYTKYNKISLVNFPSKNISQLTKSKKVKQNWEDFDGFDNDECDGNQYSDNYDDNFDDQTSEDDTETTETEKVISVSTITNTWTTEDEW